MITKKRLNYTKAPSLWEEQGKPKEIAIHLPETDRTLRISTPKRPYQAYTAGPLFTPLQRKMIEKIATIVASKGVIPYIPHIQSKEASFTGSKRRETIFQLNVKGVDTSDFLVMWADYGVEPDPGTVWEQARAYTLNKPVIALREDFRNLCSKWGESSRGNEMNLMMEQSVDDVAKNLDDLENAVEKLVKHLDKNGKRG